jgi:uncharacterized membrane protein (UPF0127 family)
MRVGPALLLSVIALLLASCGGDGEPAAGPASGTEAATKTQADPAATEMPRFDKGHVVIETGREPATVLVEIAENPQQHAHGLMFRKSLPRDRGMIFVFGSDRTGGFWMKNTLVPLSIAYYDRDGTILAIQDMEPCTADPCPTYDPGVAYRGALEVNRGAFRTWDVKVGDRVVLHRL